MLGIFTDCEISMVCNLNDVLMSLKEGSQMELGCIRVCCRLELTIPSTTLFLMCKLANYPGWKKMASDGQHLPPAPVGRHVVILNAVIKCM